MAQYLGALLVLSSEARQVEAAALLSGLGSGQLPAPLLPRRASLAEVVTIIGTGAVISTDLLDGFEFHNVTAIRMNIMSPGGFTGPRQLIATRLGTACGAIVLTIPQVEPISGTTAFGIRAPDRWRIGARPSNHCVLLGTVDIFALRPT